MSVVVDTSVIVAVILNEATKENIIKATKNQDLIAPACLNWEMVNAFSAMFKRNKISLEQALAAHEIFKTIQIRYPGIDFEDVIKISYKHKIYAYDACFLSLAKKHRCPFITLDESLQTLASKLNIKTIEVKNDNI